MRIRDDFLTRLIGIKPVLDVLIAVETTMMGTCCFTNPNQACVTVPMVAKPEAASPVGRIRTVICQISERLHDKFYSCGSVGHKDNVKSDGVGSEECKDLMPDRLNFGTGQH